MRWPSLLMSVLLSFSPVVLAQSAMSVRGGSGGQAFGSRPSHPGTFPGRQPNFGHGRFGAPGRGPGFGSAFALGYGIGLGYGFGYNPYWGYWNAPLTWDLPFWDYVNFPPTNSSQPDSYPQQPERAAPATTAESAPAAPVSAPPKMIEVPAQKGAPPAKPQPPALFVLTNGDRLESRYYLLTADSLRIEVGRQHRTIPLSSLDLDATLAANQQRGIDLRIPRDRNSLFVSF